jgi:hypothetical protein
MGLEMKSLEQRVRDHIVMHHFNEIDGLVGKIVKTIKGSVMDYPATSDPHVKHLSVAHGFDDPKEFLAKHGRELNDEIEGIATAFILNKLSKFVNDKM